jgi:hypothetical protein
MSFADGVDVVEKLTRIGAVVGGALFGYFKLLRERINSPRLEIKLTATPAQVDDQLFLKVAASIKNAGFTKVVLDRDASALRVFAADHATIARALDWQLLCTLDISERHDWIESGETISQTWLVTIPPADRREAYRAELRLVGPTTDWYADDVVAASQPK